MKNKNHIYLDYNATAPLKAEVCEVMASLGTSPLNASSVHSDGRRARKIVEDARTNLAKHIGATAAHQIIFTSSGTEANNLALNGFSDAVEIMVSAIEHVSVLKANSKVLTAPVDQNGVIDLDSLRRLLQTIQGKKPLVSVMLANNETGVIQPIAKVSELVYSFGGYVHCDAVQVFGKIPVNIQDLNVDMLTVSAHKFGGPQGAAALIIKKGIPLAATTRGGGQESGYRAGTENVRAIAGFSEAINLIKENLSAAKKIAKLRDGLERNLAEAGAVLFGADAPRLPNTSLIAMPQMKSETQLIAFDLEGISLSAGSACSSGRVETSHVLRAMCVEPELASRAIRVSMGVETTEAEIETFISVWKKLAKQSEKQKAA